MLKRITTLTLFTSILMGGLSLVNASDSLEYKLATINAKGYVSPDHLTVARFSRLLSQLSSTYVEDKQQIADMSVKAQQLLRDNGVEEDLLKIMEGLNQLFSRKIENQKYAEYASAYVTLRDKGQSHTEAINGLRALLQGIGVY